MMGEYIRDDSRELCSMQAPILPITKPPRSRKERLKTSFCFFLQIIHFFISMGYLWAGIVEFIRNPPFFDAYGDIGTSINLPPGLFKNDPRTTESGILRLMDLPIFLLLIIYQGICIWLKYKGISWLLTASITLNFLFFLIVNRWERKRFDWRHYSSRMNGLGLQVSSIALSGTMLFMVIFFKRQKFPFKFRSSLNHKQNTTIHILWNFFAIYLVMFSSMMIWFIKLYASWACFGSVSDIMQLCSTTNQVSCYPCSECTLSSLRKCVQNDKTEIFTCSSRFPSNVGKGAFCTFNFNMSIYGFLLTFAYIGGLCVFLSTFLRIAGHYLVRGIFLASGAIKRLHYNSGSVKQRLQSSSPWEIQSREMENPADDNGNGVVVVEDPFEFTSDSDEDGNLLISVAFG